MARLLTCLMIFALLVTQGSSIAAAVCRHQNVAEHVLARASRDVKVAAAASHEESAAAAAARKATQSGDLSGHWTADLWPADPDAPSPLAVERLRLRPAPESALASATVLPLLEPPSA